MGLFLFVFTVMAVVTAMVIRVRDLEKETAGDRKGRPYEDEERRAVGDAGPYKKNERT